MAGNKNKTKEAAAPVNGPKVWAMVRLHDDVCLSRHRDALNKEIASKLSGLEYFLPMHPEKIGSKIYTYVLFDGYFFVCHDGSKDFDRRLQKARGSYLDGPLQDRSRLALVKNSVVEGWRTMAREKACSYVPELGETVICIHEALERVEGEVVDIDHTNKLAHIRIKLRSRELLAPVKFANIQPKDEDPSSMDEWLRPL